MLGLDGYIKYKTSKNGKSADYEQWKEMILLRVKERLSRGDNTLYPSGCTGEREVTKLQEHLVFLKEDRAPHVVVGMCKLRYMHERDRYLYGAKTFTLATEVRETILDRHSTYHMDKGLMPNRRIPYIYGIWKSLK